MSCGCAAGLDLSEEGGESCDFAEERRITSTRKEHPCCECNRPIPTGSRCCYFGGRSESGFFHYYRCLDCAFLVEMIALEDKVCVVWCGLQYYWDEFRHHGGGHPFFHELVAKRPGDAGR